ncbi:MAG: prolyl oligopeptidase family serine peptidase, partial [bacterium]
TLCAVPLDGAGEPEVLVAGHDFFSTPRLSPDGSALAWLAWDHPRMPWDGTELCVSEVRPDGSIGEPRRVAGGPGESVLDPAWSPNGRLHFVSDRSNWWNLYREVEGGVEPLCEMEAEFAAPQWVFRRPMYAFAGSGRIVCSYTRDGEWHLGVLDTKTGALRRVDVPYTDISYVAADGGRALFLGGSPTDPSGIVLLDLAAGRADVLRASTDRTVDDGYLSEPEPIEFPTTGGQTAHALFYAPRNADVAGPAGERPPLLVKIHGGPTSACSSDLSLGLQFWTSRGFAVVDVNYGGSTGYGRAYRDRLKGRWGVVDVEDCVHAARFLSVRGSVDPDRLAIRGGSAGGYTTLCALTFRDTFKAGASYFGVSDAAALATETHKFESRYLDGLIAPYPEGRDLYGERSPIHHVEKLDCPLILFQGLEDEIVPPNQAETMFEALKAKGVPVAYLPFEGEQHGFRVAANIKRTLEAELYFYSRVFGFEPADDVEPVDIANL